MSRSAAPTVLISAVLLLSISTASAFNITVLFSRFPGFEAFNDLLTRTRVSADINRRRTITVLALANDRIGDLSGKPLDVQRRILSNHVILDYYDRTKLYKLKNNRTVLTTLYQASGVAHDQQGFLVVVHREDGSIVFGSAVRNSPLDAILEGSVAAQPYNISVLSITQPIIAPDIDGAWKPMPEVPPERAPAPSRKLSPPPAETPEEDVPADGPGPVADAPAPAHAPAPGPVADVPTADDGDEPPVKKKSDAGKRLFSGVSFGFIVAVVSFLAAH